MPGLMNRFTGAPLPLTASEISACVSGYSLGMTASLTYSNPETQSVEALFVYPLNEHTVVVGFEAVICRHIITVQIKDKAKMDESYYMVGNVRGLTLFGVYDVNFNFPPLFFSSGRILLDEDLERIIFVANLGVVPAQESVSVLISTSSELPTLSSGAVRVLVPPVCVPRVTQGTSDSALAAGTPLRLKEVGLAGGTKKLCLASLLETEAVNSIEYELTFHLEIRAPYLLAGVESPTHEIRADADPSAPSAKSIMITLANKHTYDRPVEILIHPSEPHFPHILMEEGDMTPYEYEQFLRGKSDFIRGTKKDPSTEKKTEIIRKRLIKDICHNPVVMLNFCPDLRTTQTDFSKTQGEFIFLIDRSGSMSGVNITRVRDAMLVILKSLMPTSIFNIIGFGSTFKSLFPSSQTYNEENLAIACESVKKLRADMGGTNILSPLNWIIRQPVCRGYPRLLFLLTDGAVSNTGKVIELIRHHSSFTRCYSFGIGQNACRRLVQGVASVSKGSAEFLVEGERLQPKMLQSLKKSMAPVLSDVTVEWVFPDCTEVLISPVSSSFLFPGDRLVGYGVVCNTSRYLSNPRTDKRRRYSMMHSQESGSSVFFQSQDSPGSGGSRGHQDGGLPSEHSTEFLDAKEDLSGEHDGAADSSFQRRAYRTSQIADHQPMPRVHTASDPSSVQEKSPLCRIQITDNGDVQESQSSLSVSPFVSTTKIRGAGARRPSLLQQSCPSFCHDGECPLTPEAVKPFNTGSPSTTQHETSLSLKSSSDSQPFSSPGDLDCHHPCFTFETEMVSESPSQDQIPGNRGPAPHPPSACKAVVRGLKSNQPVHWEIAFDIQELFRERDCRDDDESDLWNETFHHLAAKSIIRDFEQLAERESEIEHGIGRRFQLNAIHASKACNVISKYTAFVPVDLSNNSYLPSVVEYANTGAALKQGSQRSLSSGSRRLRGFSIGLGRSQSTCASEPTEDRFFNVDEMATSPCTTPVSSGWERCNFPQGAPRSPSVSSSHSQRSIESLFAARLSLNKTRLLTRAAKGFMIKSPGKGSEESESEKNIDYLPLVSLQLACGGFLLNQTFADAANIPMDKLKWTSPFSSHRATLSPMSHSSPSRKEATLPTGTCQLLAPVDDLHGTVNGFGEDISQQTRTRHLSSSALDSPSRSPKTDNELSLPVLSIRRFSSPDSVQDSSSIHTDSGLGSESDGAEVQSWMEGIEEQRKSHPESMIWATAVGLAWLENHSAAYFTEWELLASKADRWLCKQQIPEGRTLATVKSAAQQLFVLLRHWDENLQFNVLCYNPSSV
ncbi:PREDICTED: von Willebrand factor A domain-containing protein 5B1 [Nanorana parkeri]|uniref:von Willebrand factor A domain-containing protein 5B1 n=1 Tax=Nanorana parkeri TaxID=125878 RepID=UPI0008545410|nr:PREDICTED: von Willebrand factor A domain-containing protein 5B1 [Nanorana parkeri]